MATKPAGGSWQVLGVGRGVVSPKGCWSPKGDGGDAAFSETSMGRGLRRASGALVPCGANTGQGAKLECGLRTARVASMPGDNTSCRGAISKAAVGVSCTARGEAEKNLLW